MRRLVEGARVVVVVSGGVAGAALLQRTRRELALVRERSEELQRERERLRSALRSREAELVHRRELIERLLRGRRAERSWNDELRAQLQRERESHDEADGPADPRFLILRAAIALVEAEKGLLLSRADEDKDGRLDLVCSYGFEHDPASSSVAQRFAREVLDRDQIVREDAPGSGPDPADAEITSLVAIPLYLRGRFHGVIVCADRDGGFDEVDDDILLALGDHAGSALQSERLERNLHDAYRAAVRMLVGVLDARDPLLRLEAGESTLLARAVARRLGLGPHDLEVVATAALLRDVGNVAVPESTLLAPGPLSSDERALVQMHPRVGASLLEELPALREVATAVRFHHERLDGTGYPAGLEGDAIPFAARILAVIDAYSAMTHERPYRPALRPHDALSELVYGAAVRFDPQVVGALAAEIRASDAVSPELAGVVASAVDTAGLPPRGKLTDTDPLTLLPGHRAFHEATAQAVAHGPATIALVELVDLDAINRSEGYAAGDRALMAAARATQRAAARVGAAVFRDSGRRLAILSTSTPPTPPALLAELHTEFALGPNVAIGVAHGQPGDDGETLIARARASIASAHAGPTPSLPDNEPGD